MDQKPDSLYSGKLVVRAYSAGSAVPVPNATVVVRETAANGESQLLSIMTTDESGLTDPLTIATPSPAESLTPGGNKPYTPVTIEIYADGYYGINNVGVPIYPGITSIQPARMIPVSDEDMTRYPLGNTFVNESDKEPNL